MMKKSKIFSCLASVMVLASAMTTTAFAAKAPEEPGIDPQDNFYYNYTVSTATNKDGDKKEFSCESTNRIEYTNAKMSCNIATAQGRVELWKKPWYGGENMPLNQIFTVKSNNRAYWLNCTKENYLIHLVALNNENTSGVRQTVTTQGTFRNY